MTPFSVILIGNESLTIACGKALAARGHQVSAVVTESPEVRDWAQSAQVPVHDYDGSLPASADWVLSAANLRILRPDVLALGRKGAVNFHDGPLPQYAGLNAPVWARMAGEAQHGVTWHLIGEGIDDGAILTQEIFDISAADTAFTLNTRCFAAGLSSFDKVITALENDARGAVAQDDSPRTYFGRAHRPAGYGVVDPTLPAQAILHMVQALDHGAYWNPVCKPALLVRDVPVFFSTAEVIRSAQDDQPGTLLQVDHATLDLAVSDGVVRLGGLTAPVLPISPGDRAVAYQPDAQAKADITRAMKREDRARVALADMRPSVFTLSHGTPSGDFARLSLDTEATASLPAALLHLAADMTGTTADVAVQVPHSSPLISPWVPVRHARDISADHSAARFMADLPVRDPAIADAQPALAISEKEPLAGSLITLAGSELHYDGGAVSEAAAQVFAMRLTHLAEQIAQGVSAQNLTVLGPQELALIASWNDTDLDIGDATIVQQIEAQVARTPDATAVVVGHERLSYAELNARANQVAHVLIDKGVGHDTLVGLHSARTPEMVIGALGILKAGGAYVPLDPAYPEARIAGYLEDSGAGVVLTLSTVVNTLPVCDADVIELDSDPRFSTAPSDNPAPRATADAMAYLIFTSGSTGRPKGVKIEHRNLMNFCAGMDGRVAHDPAGTWLAVTSLNFDISVLELLYTLARGFKTVVTTGDAALLISDGPAVRTAGGMEFSLYYWGNDDGAGSRKYELLLEGAKFADAHGFCAVWTPERHFHAFGGPYPNPSVTGAAVAAVTKTIGVRAGSCVAPLHHPARIAEEWAVIDNLTNGGAGLAIASGWQPDDFVLRPENTPPDNKPAMIDSIETLRKLWRGEAVGFARSDGTMHEVVTQPRPVSKEVPIWVTTAGNPETWREAGRLGANVLTHLLGQSVGEVQGKIALYHDALREAGYDPAERSVTLMLHTFVADSRETAREIAREPMKDYLRSAAGLIKQYAWAFPAFKKPEGATNPFQLDLGSLEEDELEGILDFAFQRYFEDSGLFGTVDDCLARVAEVKAIGVTEVACLIDYGIPTQTVMDGLTRLKDVVAGSNLEQAVRDDDISIAAQMVRHEVTHLQCTPSMARMITADTDARHAMSGLRHVMIGGEALPGALVADVMQAAPEARVVNMYGPTETTIWSSTQIARAVDGTVDLGLPIANTQFHVLDTSGVPVPIGAEGELYIGGAGVARGYWQRPELTAERFVSTAHGRLYRTGDLVRRTAEGDLQFLGRVDHQIKLRGYRIELGEIEAALEAHDSIAQAVVVAQDDGAGDVRLIAYITQSDAARVSPADLRARLGEILPPHMVPSHIEVLTAFPLTPNKKVDRSALTPVTQAEPVCDARDVEAVASTDVPPDLEAQIAAIWRKVLGVAKVSGGDNFFDLGGHSLLAVQAHRELRDALGVKLSITDIFRFPVLSALSARIAAQGGAPANSGAMPAAETPASGTAASQRANARAAAMSKRRAMRAVRSPR